MVILTHIQTNKKKFFCCFIHSFAMMVSSYYILNAHSSRYTNVLWRIKMHYVAAFLYINLYSTALLARLYGLSFDIFPFLILHTLLNAILSYILYFIRKTTVNVADDDEKNAVSVNSLLVQVLYSI